MKYENTPWDGECRRRFSDAFAEGGIPLPVLYIYESTDSTNTRAKLFAEGDESTERAPVIFFAREQTGGRGTRGRAFESPTGGAYVSLLVYPEGSASDTLAITSLAAVAARRALAALCPEVEVGIKWVNDLTVRDRKLGGILTEGRLAKGGGVDYAIVGIGINVRSAPHSDGVRAVMTSLEDEGAPVCAEQVGAAVAREFIRALPELGTEEIYNEYKALSTVIGRRVCVKDATGSYRAVAEDINRDLSLSVICEGGQKRTLISADVRVQPDTDG